MLGRLSCHQVVCLPLRAQRVIVQSSLRAGSHVADSRGSSEIQSTGRAFAAVMVKAANNYYAVASGVKPGIYRTWSECQQQTSYFRGAVFKKFTTQQQAEEFLKDNQVSADEPASALGQTLQPSSLTNSAPHASRHTAGGKQGSLADPGGRAAASARGKHATAAALLQGFPCHHVGRDSIDPAAVYRLEFDGGSRGNPGLAGSGAALFAEPSHSIVGCLRLYIPHATNNVAEYMGCILGLQAAQELGMQHIEVAGDSMLVVQQLNGKWKVKHEGLKPLHEQATQLLKGFGSWTAGHVYRNVNGVADALANEAMDKRTSHRLQDIQGDQTSGAGEQLPAASSSEAQQQAMLQSTARALSELGETGTTGEPAAQAPGGNAGPQDAPAAQLPAAEPQKGGHQQAQSASGPSQPAGAAADAKAAAGQPRKRQRLRKAPADAVAQQGDEGPLAAASEGQPIESGAQPARRKRGRPRKHPLPS